MKTALIIAALLTAQTCATATTEGAKALNVRIVASGPNAAAAPTRPEALLAGSESDLRALWASSIGAGQPPAIDFTKELAVILLAGSKPTGGYTISARQASLDANGELVMEAAVEGPPAGSVVTQAFTAPWAVAAVPRVEAKRARWQAPAR